jgi:hypothetical protein
MSGQLRTYNPLNNFAQGQPIRQLPPGQNATSPLAANPLFGRPTWTYVHVQRGPVRGPHPRLAVGSGNTTGKQAAPGSQSQLPGYLTDNEYEPQGFPYQPSAREDFLLRIPRSILTGENGRELVSTYEPHDCTPADRFFTQMRRPVNWQVQTYPADYRNLLAWQQVTRYTVQARTRSALPLTADNYFLGFQINPQVASSIGQTNLGYLGSGG